MAPSRLDNSARDELLDEVLTEYLKAVEAGAAPDADALIARYPDLAPQLAEFLKDQEQLDRIAGPLREVGRAARVAAIADALDRSQSFGKYEVLDKLGEGGMAVVYKARHQDLQHFVALKMLVAGRLARPSDLERLRNEAQTVAELDHPNIVPIYEIGEFAGQVFLSLRYLEGGNLGQHLDRYAADPQAAARLLITIVRAVHHAHQRGVLHRDLKPSNILLDADGRPYVADFGLARRLDAGSTLTQSGALVGTPSYMAPEQTLAQRDAVTTAADVYGLGGILYALLTGGPPFDGSDVYQMVTLVRESAPEPPNRRNPRVDRDLAIICLHCLSKNPADRYASAEELALDLERWLEGEPIYAREASTVQRLRRWCRRHPARALATGLGGALIVVLAVVGAESAQRISQERILRVEQESADARRHALEDRKLALLQQIQRIRLTAHTAEWAKTAMDLVREGVALGPYEHWRDQAAATLIGLDAAHERHFSEDSSAVAFDKTGKRLLMAGARRFANGKLETTATRLWRQDTGQESFSEEADEGPVLFDENDNPLQLVEGPGFALVLWNVEKQEAVGKFEMPLGADSALEGWKFTSLAVSAKADYVAAAAQCELEEKAVVVVWETSSGQVKLQQQNRASALAFGHKGAWLAVGGDEEITIWALPRGNKIKSVNTGNGPVSCLAFGRNPDLVQAANGATERLAVGTSGGDLAVWDLSRGLPLCFCHGSNYAVHGLAFSPDGSVLASAGRGAAKLWDVATGQCLLDVGGGSTVSGIVFSPDGRRLANSTRTSSGEPGCVDIWRVESARGLESLRGLAGQIAQVRFSPDGSRLAALSHKGQVGIWHTSARGLDWVLNVPLALQADNAGLAFSKDGQKFAVAAGREAIMWDLAVGKQLARWPLPPGFANHLGFHGADKLLLFRVETKAGERYPSSDVPATERPRVCRIRDLLGARPGDPLIEITDFNWGVFRAGTPWDASYFVVQGIGGPDKRRFTTAFDGPSGKQLWSRPCSADFRGDGYSLRTDPTGKLMTLVTELSPDHVSLVSMPAGADFVPSSLASGAVQCISPAAKFWGASHGSPHGFHLFRREDKTPVVILGFDTPTHQVRPDFNMAGTHLAWGNDDGSVTLCDIEEVCRRLGEVGLGW